MAVVRNLMVRAGADFSALTRSTQQAQRTMSEFQNKMSKTMNNIKSILIAVGIGNVIKDSISSAMSVEASMQQIDRIMGQSADGFKKWANQTAISFNMSKQEALKYGAIYGNLISGFTKSTGETTKSTEDLLKASSIVASATGRSMEDVMERIRSGLLGNTEAIEDLGIYAQVAMLKSTDAFKKYANGKSWEQLDYQTQQQIRLMSILEQTSKKYGDTVNSNTNSSMQQLVAQLKNVQLSLGQAFLPIVNMVLPILTALASKLAYVMNIVSLFSQALFGKATKQASSQAKATDQQASSVNKLGDSYKQAGQKAKGALAGFDEINSAGSKSSGGGGSNAGSPNGNSSTSNDSGKGESDESDGTGLTDKIKVMANEFAALFAPAIAAFERFKTALAPLMSTIKSMLIGLYDNVLVPFATWTISEAVPAFLDLLSGAASVLNPLLESFKPLGEWLFVNFLQPIATWTAGAFISIIETIASTLTKLGTWMSNNKPIIEGITTTIIAFMAAWKLTELLAFVELSGGVMKALTGITAAIKAGTIAKLADKLETMALTVLYAKDFVVGIGKATAAMLVNATETLYLKALYGVDLIKAVAASVVSLAKQVIQWGINTAAIVANKVALAASTVAQVAMTVATTAWNIVGGIATVVTTALGVAMVILTSPITLVILAIAALVAGIVLLIKNWDTVKNVASNVWSGIVSVWSKASAWFSSNVVNPIANIFKGLWNGIISGMNFVIRGLNHIHFNMPDWLPAALGGGKSFGINLPEIPKLAQGGYVGANSPILAMVGDNKTEGEIIAPESKIYEQTSKAIQDALRGSRGNSNESPTSVILQIGETELGRVVIDAINKVQRIAGTTLLTT